MDEYIGFNTDGYGDSNSYDGDGDGVDGLGDGDGISTIGYRNGDDSNCSYNNVFGNGYGDNEFVIFYR